VPDDSPTSGTEIDLAPGPAAVPSLRYTVDNIDLHGGRLCLDFANTAVWRLSPQPEETLVDYAALLAWSRRAGALDGADVDPLRAAAVDRPDQAAALLERAIELREAINLVFVAATLGRSPRAPDLAVLNAALAESMAHAAVHPGPDGFAWDWSAGPETGSPGPNLARPLWPIARSAAELLVGPELARVKRCPGTNCGWLFLDTSKNASRRWCDMAVCGNRARVRAFAARKRASAAEVRSD
jgi:predicted RNA-binding Zn ribbon-like protein